MKVVNKFLVLILVILMAGCAEEAQSISGIQDPDVGIAASKLNQNISVFAPDGWNKFTTTDIISLEVNAIGESLVLFRPDNVRLFANVHGKWLEVNNKMTMSPENFEYTLDPQKSNDPMYIGTAMILPDLPNPSTTVKLRVFVFGYLFENGTVTDKMVGAYTDIRLSP